jgi:thiosulfate/3-mercaptopyruvate sulfurtransferase
MLRLFVFGTIATLLAAAPRSAAAAVDPLVSTDWLQQHLNDTQVRVIATGDQGRFERGHIPGARFLEHMDTIGGGHTLLPPDKLAVVLARAGAADGMHIVLYGDSPMTTGWVFMALASVGHEADVSMLDGGIELWRSEGRTVAATAPPPATGALTVHPAPDLAVDAAWVKGHLDSPAIRLLDVRTTGEWNAGHLPNATLVLWQDLFSDQRSLKFKSPDDIRALFAKAGVKPGQQVVTYCMVGMRASLMYWAAKSVGLPAHVYVGSWQDWSRSAENPVVK